MADRDLYEVLGVSRTASEPEIRKAYREVARMSHPDRNPGDRRAEETFKQATHAKEVLLNKKKRALYDEFGTVGLRDGFDPNLYRAYGSPGRRSAASAGSVYSQNDLQDLFNNMRGKQPNSDQWTGNFQDFVSPNVVDSIFGRTPGAQPGKARSTRRDLVSEIRVTFAESIRGVEKELSFNLPGDHSKERVLRVRIPAGVTNGGRVRLKGQGADGGDLVLQVNVDEHPFFTRDGDNLHVTLPITLAEAYQGARVPLPTADGEVMLTIPPGTQSGAKLRLRGKGVVKTDQSGDLIVTIQVRIPDGRSDQLDALVEAFSQYYTTLPRSGMRF